MSTGSILVVDDEYGVRSGIRQILEIEGYSVDESETGEDALALFEDRDYDVALLDYRLPDIDGLTLLQAIKARDRHPMVCMITAYANIDTAIAATRQGVDFFLPKPFSPDDLVGVVETLIRHKQASTEAERLRREHEASLLALAEEKTQTHSLIASLRDAVLVVNRDGAVALANRAMTRLLGVTEEACLRQAAEDVLAAAGLTSLAADLAAPIKDRMVSQLTIHEASYMASIVTFRGENGEPLGRIVTLSDISEVRRLAMEKENFIRTMVHELKSPLGAVRSLIEVTTDKSLGEDLGSYLPMLRRAEARIDGLVDLIGDLLTLSRSEQARDAARPELLEIPPLIESALGREAEQMAARNISATTEVDPDLPAVFADRDDLATVLANLVGNAVKYNREGGRISVRARREGDWVRIDVEDTGIGVAEENLRDIFVEFHRERRRETRDIEGNGLGLAIAKRLTERAGGRIEVRSESGCGSTFSVFLPA